MQGKTRDPKKPSMQTPREVAEALRLQREQHSELAAKLSDAEQKLAAVHDPSELQHAELVHQKAMKAVIDREQDIAWLEAGVDSTQKYHWKVAAISTALKASSCIRLLLSSALGKPKRLLFATSLRAPLHC